MLLKPWKKKEHLEIASPGLLCWLLFFLWPLPFLALGQENCSGFLPGSPLACLLPSCLPSALGLSNLSLPRPLLVFPAPGCHYVFNWMKNKRKQSKILRSCHISGHDPWILSIPHSRQPVHQPVCRWYFQNISPLCPLFSTSFWFLSWPYYLSPGFLDSLLL